MSDQMQADTAHPGIEQSLHDLTGQLTKLGALIAQVDERTAPFRVPREAPAPPLSPTPEAPKSKLRAVIDEAIAVVMDYQGRLARIEKEIES